MSVTVCPVCGKAVETTEELASTPGEVCLACWRAGQADAGQGLDLDALAEDLGEQPEQTIPPAEDLDASEGLDLDALADLLSTEGHAGEEPPGTERGRYIDSEGRGWGVF
jgi:hypothetical protein